MTIRRVERLVNMSFIAKCIFGLAVLALAAFFPANAESSTVRIDSVQASPGESFQVGIWLENNTDNISAMTIPLKYSSPYLTLDSVSFSGTILTTGIKGVVDLNSVGQSLRVSYIIDNFSTPLPTISASRGLLATLHFKLEPGASPGYIDIDSILTDSVVYYEGNQIRYWNRMEFSDPSGTFVIYPGFTPGAVRVLVSTDINDDLNNTLPTSFELGQNYPNPFNPSTSINYSLPRAGYVSLKVFNVIGQEVATLFEGFKTAGNHRAEFEAIDKPSGIYFYRLVHQDGSETKKMLLVK